MSEIFYVFKIPDTFIGEFIWQTGTNSMQAAMNRLWDDRKRIERVAMTVSNDYRKDIRTDGIDPFVRPWIWSAITKFYNPDHFGEYNLGVFNKEWLERLESAFSEQPPSLRVGCAVSARPAYVEHAGVRYALRADQREWNGIYVREQFQARPYLDVEFPSPIGHIAEAHVKYEIIRFGFSADEYFNSQMLGRELRYMFEQAVQKVATGVYSPIKDQS